MWRLLDVSPAAPRGVAVPTLSDSFAAWTLHPNLDLARVRSSSQMSLGSPLSSAEVREESLLSGAWEGGSRDSGHSDGAGDAGHIKHDAHVGETRRQVAGTGKRRVLSSRPSSTFPSDAPARQTVQGPQQKQIVTILDP